MARDNEPPPTVSDLIAAWNGRHDLERCLETVEASTFKALEVVVIDNASTDGTVEMLRERFPHVAVHVNRENLGHTRAINQGLAMVRGRLVLDLDVDVEVERATPSSASSPSSTRVPKSPSPCRGCTTATEPSRRPRAAFPR